MDHLPPECLINILRYSNLPDVICLLRTSKHWHSVITLNETIIYQRLAGDYDSKLGHGPFRHLQDALDTWASPSAKSIKTWKQYCKLQTRTEQRWRGKRIPSYTLDFCGSTQTHIVQNIQIDLKKSLLLTTEIGRRGAVNRIIVRCLLHNSHPTLFTLFMEDIIHRIEISNGFLVCKSQEKLSIWRWAQDQQRDPVPLEPAPWQTRIYEHAMRLADAPHRGELIPILAIPKPNYSLYPLIRFRYPTLCIWSEMHEPIRFWSFESRSFDRSIELDRPDTSMYHTPLDFNDTHVFIVLDSIMIYDRLTCDLVFQFEYDCVDIARLYSTLPSLSRRFQDRFEEYVLSHHRDPESTPRDPPLWVDGNRVLEVYSSPTGNNLVGIMSRGCIFHCPIGLENPAASKGRISFTRVQTKLWTAAYDGHKIVAYGPQGLSIIYLVDQPDPGTFPAITMYHTSAFLRRYFEDHDRVEMTRDTCWLSFTSQGPGCVVGMMDFAEEFKGEGEIAAES